jgi:hypothetical protein
MSSLGMIAARTEEEGEDAQSSMNLSKLDLPSIAFSNSDWIVITCRRMPSAPAPAAESLASGRFGFEREEERREGREAIRPETRYSSWRRRSSMEVRGERRGGIGARAGAGDERVDMLRQGMLVVGGEETTRSCCALLVRCCSHSLLCGFTNSK